MATIINIFLWLSGSKQIMLPFFHLHFIVTFSANFQNGCREICIDNISVLVGLHVWSWSCSRILYIFSSSRNPIKPSLSMEFGAETAKIDKNDIFRRYIVKISLKYICKCIGHELIRYLSKFDCQRYIRYIQRTRLRLHNYIRYVQSLMIFSS